MVQGSVSFAVTTGGLIKDLLGWGAGAQTRMNLWLYCIEALRSENIRLKQKFQAYIQRCRKSHTRLPFE